MGCGNGGRLGRRQTWRRVMRQNPWSPFYEVIYEVPKSAIKSVPVAAIVEGFARRRSR